MYQTKVAGGNELLNPEFLLKEQLGIGNAMTVADLGCGGAGYFTLQAAGLVGEHGKVYAVDVQKKVLQNIDAKAAVEGFENIKTVWSNLERYGATEINDQSLDHALLINTLFQNQLPESVMKEAARMIKKDGHLLVIDWRPGRFAFGPKPEAQVSIEKVKEIAEGLGLKETKSFDAGKFHYGIIFDKII
jgi:ubiquinone/menaquinone biosynthesis C-methylase UbiE